MALPFTSLESAPVFTLTLPVLLPFASDVYTIDVQGSVVTVPV